jgi:hypothetical protein
LLAAVTLVCAVEAIPQPCLLPHTALTVHWLLQELLLLQE